MRDEMINKNILILVIDDNKTMRRIVRTLLNQLGYNNVEEAEDGVSAFNMIKEKNYQLVISDWNMTPITGLELLQQVRAVDAYKNLPFIMVTAESKMENIVEAKNAGANNYIVKPFSASTLEIKLNAVLDK